MSIWLIAGNTTNLASHLKRDHPELDPSTKARAAQPTIVQSMIFQASAPLAQARKVAIDRSLEDFVVRSLSPLSLVEKPHFKSFVAELEPKYTTPSAKTLKNRLHAENKKGVEEIKGQITPLQNVAITHDSWTSLATENYETVTCHFIRVWQWQTMEIEWKRSADNED